MGSDGSDLASAPLLADRELSPQVQILGAVPAAAGLVVMVLLVPVTRSFLRKSKAFQKTIMAPTQTRVFCHYSFLILVYM